MVELGVREVAGGMKFRDWPILSALDRNRRFRADDADPGSGLATKRDQVS